MKKWYQKMWFTVVLLILFPPAGIILLWVMQKEKSKNFKILLTILSAVWLILALIFGGNSVSTPQTNSNNGNSNNSALASEPEKEKTAQEEIAEKYSVPLEIVSNIETACVSIGMPADKIKYTTLSFDGTTGSADIEYETAVINVTVNSDYSVSQIISGDIVFYKDGAVVENINNVIYTTEQQSTLISKSKEVVEQYLKAPSTAEFPGLITELDQWQIKRGENTYRVTSWVDSQNSFGAQVRSDFTITYQWDGSANTEPQTISLIIDGEQYI